MPNLSWNSRYKTEVLRRRVEKRLTASGRSQVTAWQLGTITKLQIMIDPSTFELVTTHFIEFDDGEVVWVNLESDIANGRVRFAG